ncbi:acyl-CoA dehydrogenase family protein, partial [Leucobacter chromiiresistens]
MEHRTRSGESARVRFAPHAEPSGDSPDSAHASPPLPEGPPATVADALAHAQRIAPGLRSPGRGHTQRLWEHLATLAAHDLGIARAVEPHLDACAILDQAGLPLPDGAWGVFAAEGGPDPLRATPHETRAAAAPPTATAPPAATAPEPEWSITGEKLWCSLAAQLDGALVTAATDDGPRLFAVDLRDPGVRVRPDAWAARGLVEIPSGPVTFDRVPAA